MRRTGVICEFNPFHNGHKFLLEKIKQEHADEVICIMSGSFVQRGDIAIVNKFERTKAALSNGADMVVELPTPYAVSSARFFAQNGVRIAASLHCDDLCFGAENSTEELRKLCRLLKNNSVEELIKAKMSEGLYYPRALKEAVSETAGEDVAKLMKDPNNILAIEYMTACEEFGISPIVIKRQGVSHDSTKPCGNIASASYIRELVKKDEDYSDFTAMKIVHPADLSAIESAVLYSLKTKSAQEIALLADVSEGLEHRISEAAQQYNSIKEILNAVKTKRYTHAHLRRILIYSLLGITGDLQNTPVPYLRVLGVRSGCEHLMKDASLPLIVKVRSDVNKLQNSAEEIFKIDLKATQAMNLVRNEYINEFSQGIFKD